MLTYAETAHRGTPVPLEAVPGRPSQECTAPSSSSYAIGPLDPAQLHASRACLTTGEEISLLVPANLPHTLHTDPDFKDGYEWGYHGSDLHEEGWTIPKLVNQTYASLTYQCLLECPTEELGDYPWTLGVLLGTLAKLAESDRILALTGLAPAHYLLTLLPIERTSPWPWRLLSHARCLHNRSLHDYRARVRSYREQGQSFEQAQRLALASPQADKSLLPC